MSKIFRGLRGKSIQEGGLKNYLPYAIGEIILVVLGILIAVQINNWNNHRLESKREARALKDLHGEFIINKNRIQEKQDARIIAKEKIHDYIIKSSKREVTFEEFEEMYGTNIFIGMTNPSYGVINTLISSGDINLIQNDSLKYLLTDWKDQAGNLLENETILWEGCIGMADFRNRNYPDQRYEWYDNGTEWKKQQYKRVAADMVFRNMIVGLEGAFYAAIEVSDHTMEHVDHILVLLEEEME